MNTYPDTLIPKEGTETIFGLTQHINLKIDAYSMGVWRLRFGYKKHIDSIQNLRLSDDLEKVELSSYQEHHTYILKDDLYTLKLQSHPFSLAFYREDTLLWQTSSHYTDPLVCLQDKEGRPQEWGLMLDLPSDVYGLGQTAGLLSRCGELIRSTDEGYQPFAWTTQGWGLCVLSWGATQHALTTVDQTYELYCQDQCLDLLFFHGNPHEIFNQYANTCGRITQVPLSALGVSIEQQPTQSNGEFICVAQSYRNAGIGIEGLNFTYPSFTTFANNKAQVEWDERRQEKMDDFLQHLYDHHWTVCIPTLPAVPAGTALFDELDDRAWLLQNEEGFAYIFSGEKARMPYDFALLDLTYKDARQLWLQWHKNMLISPMIDGHLPVDLSHGVFARNGDSGVHLHHMYQLYLAQILYLSAVEKKVPAELAMRNGTVALGSQRYLWSQIKTSHTGWDGLQDLIYQSISQSNSGQLALQLCLDQALFGTKINAEFVYRVLSFAIFTPTFSWPANSDLLQCLTGALAEEFAHLFQFRSRLLPYLYGLIEDANRNGTPVLRSMSFFDDPQAQHYPHQYLLGDALLLAPVFTPQQTTQTVYLPAGQAWWDLNTGVRYEGGQAVVVDCSVGVTVAFGREGRILCLGPVLQDITEFNTARILEEVWMFGMPRQDQHPLVMRNKIRVLEMQGSSYLKGLEGLRIMLPDDLEVKRRGAEVRISPKR